MPLSPSGRAHPAAVRRAEYRSSRKSPRKSRTPIEESESDSNEDVVVIDVDKIRRGRAEFYNKTLESKVEVENIGDMSKDGEEHRRKRRTRHTSTVTVDQEKESPSKHHHHHHRRRRRRSRTEPEARDDAEYVYGSSQRVAQGKENERPQSSKPYEPTTNLLVPRRVELLRQLGLSQAPLRVSSQRTVRRPKANDDEEVRRHSYHGSSPPLPPRSVNDVTRAKVRLRRSQSLRENATKSPATRPALNRSQTTKSRQTRKISPPVMPAVEEEQVKAQSGTNLARSNSVMSSLFKSSRPAPREKKVTCLTCMADDVPISKSAKLLCTHRMCHDCLKRVFRMSVKDPAHMPPKCCTQDCIPLKHVEKLFTNKFKATWNTKYQEFTTKNRIYCPAKGCGTWIPPKQIKLDASSKRKQGVCGHCKTKVCATCNGKWHGSRPCQSDEETAQFQEMAKDAGWQRCYNCGATVELKEGCNHMTCRCTAEFCIICGLKWKTCDCPWFNYATVEHDRLEHMNVPVVRVDHILGARRPAPAGFQEELDQRREQERLDEQMARNMQNLDIDMNIGAGRPRRNRPVVNWPRFNPPDFGAAVRPPPNNDHVLAATNILGEGYDPAARAALDILDEIRNGPRMANAPPLNPNPPAPAAPVLRRANTTATATAARRASAGIVPGPGREAERLTPRRPTTDFNTVAARFAPNQEALDNTIPPPTAAEDVHTPSTLAGLQRRTNVGRVDAWRRHIS